MKDFEQLMKDAASWCGKEPEDWVIATTKKGVRMINQYGTKDLRYTGTPIFKGIPVIVRDSQ